MFGNRAELTRLRATALLALADSASTRRKQPDVPPSLALRRLHEALLEHGLPARMAESDWAYLVAIAIDDLRGGRIDIEVASLQTAIPGRPSRGRWTSATPTSAASAGGPADAGMARLHGARTRGRAAPDGHGSGAASLRATCLDPLVPTRTARMVLAGLPGRRPRIRRGLLAHLFDK